ncbi:MAG: ATP-binding protein [Mucilaginibacter sp.]
MSIRNNLRFGIGFIFLVAVLSSGLAAYYLYKLSADSKAILKDNYDSLLFTKNIDQALDNPPITDYIHLRLIEDNIKKEELNSTEPGEKEMTDSLYKNFKSYCKYLNTPSMLSVLHANMKKYNYNIMQVNLEAIRHKNLIANHTANEAIIIVASIDSFCLILALLFLVRFPAYILKPIRELNEGIGEIANHNYEKRLVFTAKDEFWNLANAFNTMAARLFDFEHRNLAQLKQQEVRVETIVKNVTDAIIGFDENDRILFANPVAVKLLGIDEGDIVGRRAMEVAIDNELFSTLIDRGEESNDLKLYLDGEKSYFMKEIFEFVVPGEAAVAEDSNKTLRRKGYFILLKNITRFYQLDEAKTNFIATISHELKTPISSLKMSLKLMQDRRYGTITKFQKELIHNIDDDSNRLLKITSELLDMGQVETGKLLLNFGSTNPKSIVKYSCATVKFIAEQKELILNVKCPRNLPEVWVDPDKTAWVLINFLTNAIKYSSPNATIDITVRKISSAMVEFSVRDAGKGIGEIYLPRIFERYFKVPDSDFSVTGTGLGLAIAKDFIEGQGGKIGVESKVGEGSRFFFQVPVA